MSRYTGPKIKKIRALKFNSIGFTTKKKFRTTLPGEHKFQKQKTEYGRRFIEKQKIKIMYDLKEKQMYKYINEIKKKHLMIKKNLITLLEMRLDVIIFRLNFTPTIRSARQLVNHGHIYVNQIKINIPSFQCKMNDIIKIKKQIYPIQKNKLPKHLAHLKTSNEQIGKIINYIDYSEKLSTANIDYIIELYARK